MKPPVILLVEDQPDDIELTLRAFQRSRVASQIVVARDGAEALDWLFVTGEHAGRDPQVQPRLVLLDLHLPKIDGLEVLRRIRAETTTRLLPVVVLTSSREECDRTQGYTLGANSYVRKPVDFDRFMEAAQQLGSYWLGLNEPPPGADP
jgi:two-component system response regulator